MSNDERFADAPRLNRNDAIDRILAPRSTSVELLELLGIKRARRTVCLDFDDVIHSFGPSWCGAEVIPDLSIHGTKEAIAGLRERYRVVVLSSRCHLGETRGFRK